MRNYSTFYDLMRFLKKNLPLKNKVIVRRVNLADDLDGDCSLQANNEFRIRVNRNISQIMAIEVMIHEFSHCLAWDENSRDDYTDHDHRWGRAYSLVYRKFIEWNEITNN